jgi:hypothetical protein
MPRVEPSARRPPWEVIGLAGAMLVFVASALSFALQVPHFYGTDERAHLGYAHAVAAGRLPEIDDRFDIPVEATEWQHVVDTDSPTASYRTVWVANHPPLHYALVAPLIWLSSALGRADGGVLWLRFANIAFAAVGIVFTYLLTVQLTAGARRIALAAACLVAFVPRGHYEFAQALNDGLGLAATTAAAWAAVRYLRSDHTTRGLLVLAACVAVAAGTRAAAMIAALAAVAVVALHDCVTSSRRSRAGAAGRAAAVAVLPAVVIWGWFYVRNVVLYGDIGASSYLLERFDRSRRGSTLDMASRASLWVNMYQTLVTESLFSLRPRRPGSIVAVIAALVAAAGLVTTAVTGRTGDAGSDGRRWTVGRWGLLVCGGVCVATVVSVAQHIGGGGSISNRYLFPALGTLAALFAIGLDRVVPRILPAAAVVLLAVSSAHYVPSRVADDIDRVIGDEPLVLSGWPLVVVVVIAVVGVALLIAGLLPLRQSSRDGPEMAAG